jgi:hypothetical protein
MKKQGLSLLSMVIYVALFFAFMTFATVMSTNLNYSSLTYKGKVMNYENFEKLQSNMVNSAKNSTSIDNINGSIVFSNGDEYVYNSDKKAILKNGGLLVSNVSSFDIVSIDELTNVPSSFTSKESGKYVNIDELKSYVCLNVTLQKYGSTNEFQVFTVAGDDVIE